MSSNPQLRELFDALVELDHEARRARLQALHLDRQDAERLAAWLAADTTSDFIIPDSAESLMERMAPREDLVHQWLGTEVGPFKLVELIGEGGTSVVFKAARPVGNTTQTVALKLMYGGLHSPGQQRRSAREQSILAQLNHPNIARLIDAGASEQGAPYIAMEYIEGAAITQWCEARGLSLRQRLELMIQLCAPIDAAHAMLAVHCDLKPSNVFVDAQGSIKVLDFGVARLIGGEAGHEPTRTFAFTPEYAAPEQFEPGPTTVAVDIFSLGVLLCELLTGQRLRAAQTLPSQRVLASDAALPQGLPAARMLSKALHGDLDAVIAKATAHEPHQRYRSASALADDLRRYLDRRPVLARRWTRRYRIGKFLRRNRWWVGASAAFAAAIALSVTIAWDKAMEARAYAEAARAQAARADGMRDTVFDVFSEADPTVPRDHDVTVVEAVERGIERLLADDTTDAHARFELLDKFANTIGRQGHVERAATLLSQIYERAVRELGAQDPVTLSIGDTYGDYLENSGRYGEFRSLATSLLEAGAQAPPELRVRLLGSAASAAWRNEDAEAARRDGRAAVDLSRTLGDPELRRTTLSNFSVVLLGIGDVEEAIPIFEELLRLNIEAFGPNHASVSLVSSGLARAYRRVNRLDLAERYALQTIAIDRAIYDDNHWILANHLNALSLVQISLRKFDEALLSNQECLRIQQATLPPDHPDMRAAYGNLASVYVRMERFEEAIPYLDSALASKYTDSSFDRWGAGIYHSYRGYAAGMAGRTQEGLRELEAAHELFAGTVPPNHAQHALALERMLRLALHAHDEAAAATALAKIEPIAAAVAAPEDAYWRGRVAMLKASAALASGRAPDALAQLALAEAQTRTEPNSDMSFAVETGLLKALAQASSGLPKQAEATLSQAQEQLRNLRFPPSHLSRYVQQTQLALKRGEAFETP